MKISLIGFCSIIFLFSCSPKLSPDNNWAEGKWIVTELKEVPVQVSGNTYKDAHIEFMPSTKKYQGFGGCDNISGSYTVSSDKIKFTPSGAKGADCPDTPFETTFLNLLKDVDKYTLSGNTMTLKKGKSSIVKLQRKY